MASIITNFPQEIRSLSNWLLAGPNEKGQLKVPSIVKNNSLVKAAWKKDPSCTMSFLTASAYAGQLKCGQGILLRESDGYTVIDFDIKDSRNCDDPAKFTSPQRLSEIEQIIIWLDSYTERSISGVGYHVIVKGSIGAGIKHGDIEIYSRERFIACTGDIYLDRPIANRAEQLQQIVENMPRRKIEDGTELTEVDPIETDEDVLNSLLESQSVGARFRLLWNGHFDQYATLKTLGIRETDNSGELDLSVVDHAVVEYLAFRTQSNEQVRRLFSLSPLATREWQPSNKENRKKHWHGNGLFNPRHVNMCLKTLRPILKQEQKEKELEIANVQFDLQEIKEKIAKQTHHSLTAVSIDALDLAFKAGALDTSRFVIPTIDWPPGLVGELAQFIYNTSHKPVKEVAITGALGLMAGITGRTYQLTHTGINLFLILVARSGVGKEAMHSGISLICKNMRDMCPDIYNFVQTSKFASGQALMKSFVVQKSFVHPMTEVGGFLERIAMSRMDANASFFKEQILQLFNKSGINTFHGGARHSNAMDNVAGVFGPAFTLIGDSQPTTFYNCLTEQMMADGTISRFVVIEHKGEREHTNENAPKAIAVGLGQDIKERFKEIIDRCLNAEESMDTLQIQFDYEAKELISRIDRLADDIINSTDNEGTRQRWNRFKEYVERISSVIAVPESPGTPLVKKYHVEWALNLMIRNVIMFDKQKRQGQIGSDDWARQEKVKNILHSYIHADTLPKGSSVAMKNDYVVSYRYIYDRARVVAAFANHNGITRNLDSTLKQMYTNGYIIEVPEAEAIEKYKTRSACYRITPEFIDQITD